MPISCYQVIAESLSEEEIAGLREMFKAMDTDNSGAITFDELKAGLRRYGSTMKDTEIRDLMDAVRCLCHEDICVSGGVCTCMHFFYPVFVVFSSHIFFISFLFFFLFFLLFVISICEPFGLLKIGLKYA